MDDINKQVSDSVRPFRVKVWLINEPRGHLHNFVREPHSPQPARAPAAAESSSVEASL